MPTPLGRPTPGITALNSNLPVTPERILLAALAAPHAFESADGFAHRVGLRSRHQLNRVLRKGSMPAFGTLSSFVRVLALRDEAELAHRSLCAQATYSGFEASWVFRTIKRVTGRNWSAVRGLTHDELIALALAHCSVRSSRPDRRKAPRD